MVTFQFILTLNARWRTNGFANNSKTKTIANIKYKEVKSAMGKEVF